MRKSYSIAALAVMSFVVCATDTRAQERPPEQQPSATVAGQTAIPVEVEVVISRFEGDKRISSFPYILAVNAAVKAAVGPETQLNMTAEVPVPTMFVGGGDNQAAPPRAFNYRSVGTNINAMATTAGDGRFELRLSIDDSSVYATPQGAQAGPIVAEMPVIRNFRTRNTLLLRDGQTREYTAATDRVNGEIVKIEVTLRVVK